MGTTLPQKEIESGNFIPSRDIKTKKIKSLNTIYDLNVGVVERAANFTVNGRATVKDAAFFEDRCRSKTDRSETREVNQVKECSSPSTYKTRDCLAFSHSSHR